MRILLQREGPVGSKDEAPKKTIVKKGPKNPAALLATDTSDEAEAEPWCMGNVFPSPEQEFQVGLSTSPQVFPDANLTALRTVLTNNPAWSFDRVWQFKAKVTSGFARSLDFGMAGGTGFLKFSVPANAGSATVEVTGKVKTEAGYVSLVYRGSPSELVPHKVTFSQVCLRQLPHRWRPRPCKRQRGPPRMRQHATSSRSISCHNDDVVGFAIDEPALVEGLNRAVQLQFLAAQQGLLESRVARGNPNYVTTVMIHSCEWIASSDKAQNNPCRRVVHLLIAAG